MYYGIFILTRNKAELFDTQEKVETCSNLVCIRLFSKLLLQQQGRFSGKKVSKILFYFENALTFVFYKLFANSATR